MVLDEPIELEALESLVPPIKVVGDAKFEPPASWKPSPCTSIPDSRHHVELGSVAMRVIRSKQGAGLRIVVWPAERKQTSFHQ